MLALKVIAAATLVGTLFSMSSTEFAADFVLAVVACIA